MRFATESILNFTFLNLHIQINTYVDIESLKSLFQNFQPSDTIRVIVSQQLILDTDLKIWTHSNH